MTSDLSASLDRLGRPIVVASFPRSGTHLTVDLIRRQFDAGGWKLPMEGNDAVYLALERLLPTNSRHMTRRRALRRLRRSERPIIKTHGYPDLSVLRGELSPWREWLLQEADFVYCYRDGRDVVCSMHLRRKGFDPTARVPLATFIRQPKSEAVPGGPPVTSRPNAWARHVAAWLATPGVVPIRFEDTLADPRRVLATLESAFGTQPRNRDPVLPAPFTTSLQSRRGRLISVRPRATTLRGRPRGEILERWREAFTEGDRRFFHEEAGDLLVELGYEASPAWWQHNPSV